MSLENYRKEIDKIDNQILELLAKRDKEVEKVKKFKEENDMPKIQSSRWEKVLQEKVEKWKILWVQEWLIREIWEAIHKYSLKKQNNEQ